VAFHPATPAQFQEVVERYAPGAQASLVGLAPEPWRRGKRVRVDRRRGIIRAPYRKPYADDEGRLQVLVATLRFPLDKPMPPR